jgi:hypothetical protein
MSALAPIDAPDSQLLTIRGLRLDFLLREPKPVPIGGEPRVILRVPSLLADFILLTFAEQPREVFETPVMYRRPAPVMLRLPVSVPLVLDRTGDGKTQLGFIDGEIATAAEIQDQVKLVLNTLHKGTVLVIELVNVGRDGFALPTLNGIAVKHNCVMLKTKDIVSDGGKIRRFSLYVRHTSQDVIRLDIDRLFEEVKMCRCRKCRDFYNAKRPDDCGGPKIAGLQIQVKGGSSHEPDQSGILSAISYRERPMAELLK